MIRFEDIYETVRSHHPGTDLELLRKAYIFSAVEHKGQTRASGEPYLVHPLEVAAILAEMRMDPACVAVGPAARRARGHPHRARAHQGVLRRGRAPHRGGRHQDQQDPVLLLRGAPGRELPEAAAGHGRRRARHPGEAGRPPAQHAHAAVPARGPAHPHRARDHGHLRAPRRPPGHGQDQERAGGPLLPVPGARGLPGARRRRWRSGGNRRPRTSRRSSRTLAEKLEAAGLDGGGGGAHQAPVLHPPEAASASASTSTRSTTSWRCAWWSTASPTATPCSASCTTSGGPCPAASRTSSPCPGRTATSRCTPPSSATRASPSRCRSARARCTAWPRRASPRTGSTRRAGAAWARTTRRSPGCASSWSGSRRSRTRTSS